MASKQVPSSSYMRNVLLFKDEDVTRSNGEVYTPNLMGLSALRKTDQFSTNVCFREDMSDIEISNELKKAFPDLTNRRFFCATSVVGNNARLDFDGERRVWNGATIKRKANGGRCLYIVPEVEQVAHTLDDVTMSSPQPTQNESPQGSGQQPQGAPLAVVFPQNMQSTSTHGGFQPTQQYQPQSVVTLMAGTQVCYQKPPQLHHHHQQLGSGRENTSMQSVVSFSQPIASAVEVLNNEHTFFRIANEAQLQQSTSLHQLSQQTGPVLSSDMMLSQPSPAALAIQPRVAPALDIAAGFTRPIQNDSFQGSGQQPQGAPLAVVFPQNMQSTSTHGGFQPTQQYQPQSVVTLMAGTQDLRQSNADAPTDQMDCLTSSDFSDQESANQASGLTMVSESSDYFSEGCPLEPRQVLQQWEDGTTMDPLYGTAETGPVLSSDMMLPQPSPAPLASQPRVAPALDIAAGFTQPIQNDSFQGCSSQSRQVRLQQWEDGTIMDPMYGPKQGGTSFKIRLTSSSVEFEHLLAIFGGIPGSKKVVHCEENIWVGLTPKGNEPGPVEVVFKTPNGIEIGTACFEYYDDGYLCSTIFQLPFNSDMDEHQGNSGAGAGNNSGNSNAFGAGNNSDNSIAFGWSSQGRGRQAVDVLRWSLYTAARNGFRQFIRLLFGTFAGRIIFETYKNKTPLPEDIADANGHSEIAVFLRDVTERFSSEGGPGPVQSKVINWSELVRAVKEIDSDHYEGEEKLWKDESLEKPYFADVSSSDSDKENSDSDEELKRAVFKDSKRGDEKEEQVPNHLLKSKLCGDESDEPDDPLSELTKLSLEDGKELHEAFSEAKQEGKWKQDSQGEEKEQTERTNFPKSDKSGEPVVPELTTLSLEDGQDPTGISIHHVSGKEEEQLREGEILRPVDTGGDDMPSTFSEKKTDDSEDRSQAKFGQDKPEILPECKIPGKSRIYVGEGDEASVFFSELHGTTSEKKGSEEWIQDPERDTDKESEVVWESKYDDHESEPAMSYPLPEQMRLADIKDDKGVPVIIESIRELYRVREGYILPVAWCQDFTFPVNDIFTKLRLVSKEKVRGTTFDEETKMTSIFKAQADCLKPRCVLIEGEPGMGKTTYCQKLAYDWATRRADDWDESFPMIEVVLLLRCRDVHFTSSLWDAIDDQVLPMDLDEEAKKAFFQFIRENQSKVLLVMDGLDEATASELPMFVTMVEGRTLPDCHIVVTSRPETGKKIRRYCDTLWEIVGFSKSDAADFIRKYYRGTDHLAEKLLQILGSLSWLSELIRNPVMTALLCVLFEDFEGVLPNESLVYTELVLCILRRYEQKEGRCSDDLMAVYKRELILLGRKAFLALCKGNWYIEKDVIGDIPDAVFEFGFLNVEPGRSKRKPSWRYGFLHKTFQEFFAGLYLAFQILDGEMDCDTVVTDCMYNEELKGAFSFMSGIVASQSEETAVSLTESVTAHETLPLSNPFKKGSKEELKEAFSFMSGIVASQSEETSVSLAESGTARETSPLSTPGNHGYKHQWSSIGYMSACSAGKAVQSKRQPINSYSWRPQRSLALRSSQLLLVV